MQTLSLVSDGATAVKALLLYTNHKIQTFTHNRYFLDDFCRVVVIHINLTSIYAYILLHPCFFQQ